MEGESPQEALDRAAQSVIDEIHRVARAEHPSNLRTVDQLDAGACSVRVWGDVFGYEGVTEDGRMVLWHRGSAQPFYYGPTCGEVFAWAPLIGDSDE